MELVDANPVEFINHEIGDKDSLASTSQSLLATMSASLNSLKDKVCPLPLDPPLPLPLPLSLPLASVLPLYAHPIARTKDVSHEGDGKPAVVAAVERISFSLFAEVAFLFWGGF